MKLSIRKTTIVLVLVNSVLVLLMLSLVPNSEGTSFPAVTPDKILIIAETPVDIQLAAELMSEGPGTTDNYTLVTISDQDNLTQVLVNAQLENYHTLVIISGNLTANSTISSELLAARVSSGMSLVLISSKLWQLDDQTKDLLGVTTLTTNGEYIPQYGKDFTLNIQDASILKKPFEFVNGQQIDISARASYIENTDPGVVTLASSTDLGGVPGRTTGIYLKNYPSQTPGKLLTVPFTLQGFNATTNTEIIELINSAVYDLATYSSNLIQGSSEETTSIQSTDPNNPFVLLFKDTSVQTVVVAGSIVAGSILLTGFAVKQIKPSTKTSNAITDPDDDESETWKPGTGWLLFLIAPLIAVFSQVIYSPKIRKIDLEKVKDNQIRQDILDVLEYNGFEHFNSLKNQLKTGVSVLKWHLQVLEDFELIRSLSYGQFSVFYLVGNRPSQEDVKLYYTLRSNKALKIATEFLSTDSWNVSNLSDKLSMNRDTVKYHCYKLVSAGVVDVDEETGTFSLRTKKRESLRKLIERTDFYLERDDK
ncbi:MAG: hypothetical protein ACFFD4_18635 [Candidatus Odinarchaeota archaeon]